MAFNIFQKFSGKKGAGEHRAPRTTAKNRASSERKDITTTQTPATEAALTNEVVVRSSNGVLLIPHISEKATALAEGSKNRGPAYIFRVADTVNKLSIKAAVENRYKVKVDDVRIVNLPGKARRRGRVTGHQAGYKKAIVALEVGQIINEF